MFSFFKKNFDIKTLQFLFSRETGTTCKRMAVSNNVPNLNGNNLEDIKNVRRKKHEFLLGVIVLLFVDLLWVGSAELSDYIFKEIKYDKPYFTTYFKTAFFSLFLFGFCCIRNWRYQMKQWIMKGIPTKQMLKEVSRVSQAGPSYGQNIRDEEGISCETSANSTPGYITPPRYENMTDDDSISVHTVQHNKTVKFNEIREVRSLAERHSEAQVLSRMSHNSVEELKKVLLALQEKLPLRDTIKLSTYFVILWTFATLSYQGAIAKTSPSVTNILSATSGIFTLCFAACFPSSSSDRFNVSKLLAVLVSFGGVVVVCLADPNKGSSTINMGDLYAIAGAILYATYLVLIKRKVGEDQKLDMPLFFGFVGLFGALIFWPGFFILHYTGVEKFELPPDLNTWLLLLLNAFVGTLLSEVLWLWGCFLTSSLMATLSLGLVAPLSMAFDMVFHGVRFSNLFFLGVVPILVSFVVVSLLTHFQGCDPVKTYFEKLLIPTRFHEDGEGEGESLLNDRIA